MNLNFLTYPSIIIASRVVLPFSSGLPPKPTVPSHCSRSQTLQPATTASTALAALFLIASQALKKKPFKLLCKQEYGEKKITFTGSRFKIPSIYNKW